MNALTVRRRSGPGGERLEVTGELTYDNLWPLRRELLRPAAADLTVDLRGVTFLDNDAVALLVHAQRQLRGEGLMLTLLATGGGQPDRLLRLRRLDTVIPLLTLSGGGAGAETNLVIPGPGYGTKDTEACPTGDAPGERPPMNANTLTLAAGGGAAPEGAALAPEGAVLALAGDVDLHTLPALEAALAGAVAGALQARGGARLTLDLRAVEYMDSGGLAALIRARKSLAAGDGALHLRVAPGSQPDRVLRLSRLDALMPLTYAPPG